MRTDPGTARAARDRDGRPSGGQGRRRPAGARASAPAGRGAAASRGPGFRPGSLLLRGPASEGVELAIDEEVEGLQGAQVHRVGFPFSVRAAWPGMVSGRTPYAVPFLHRVWDSTQYLIRP